MPGVAVSHRKNIWIYHVVALVTALVWSTTFVSTKILLNAGLSPETIFIYRFLIAYVGILFVSHDRWKARSWKDEGLLLLAGVAGGSLYFYTENTALRFTYTSNVSILVSTTPLITMFLAAIVNRQPFRRTMFLGSLLALAGVSLVVLNGRGVEGVSPFGDFLSMVAAVCWSVYSVAVTALGKRDYPSLFITRKIFFYGLLTMCMVFPFSGCSMRFELLKEPVVLGNILFLGVIASLVCYAIWSRIIEVLGPDKATNYIYLNPLGAITTAVIVLNEPLSLMAIAGAVITITGVVIVEKVR